MSPYCRSVTPLSNTFGTKLFLFKWSPRLPQVHRGLKLQPYLLHRLLAGTVVLLNAWFILPNLLPTTSSFHLPFCHHHRHYVTLLPSSSFSTPLPSPWSLWQLAASWSSQMTKCHNVCPCQFTCNQAVKVMQWSDRAACGKSQKRAVCQPFVWLEWVRSSETGYSGSCRTKCTRTQPSLMKHLGIKYVWWIFKSI